MKKMTVLFAMALLLGFPLAAMSATTFMSTGADPEITEETSVMRQYRTSTNVTLIGTGDLTTYAAISAHLNGTRAFGSSSQDSQLWWQPKDVGVSEITPSASDSAAFASGWSTL